MAINSFTYAKVDLPISLGAVFGEEAVPMDARLRVVNPQHCLRVVNLPYCARPRASVQARPRVNPPHWRSQMLPLPTGFSSFDLIFDDQFTESSLNPADWNPWIGDSTGRYADWDGQENLLPFLYSGFTKDSQSHSENYDDPSHIAVGNGTLSLTASPSDQFSNLGYSWAGAGISGYGLNATLPATGGYVQWQAKMPDSSAGAWGGLWMIGANGQEFDVQESGYLDGNANPNDVLAANWHGGAPHQVIEDTGVDLSADYHTYGLEYVPGQSFTEFLDGQQVAQWTQTCRLHLLNY